MRTGNPTLSDKTFQGFGTTSLENRMTIEGTVYKTAALLGILLFSALYVWDLFFKSYDMAVIMPYMLAGGIGGFVVAIFTIFKKEYAYISAPIYAALEGLFLGGISAQFETMFPGIVMQAVALTFGTLFSLLLAYRSGLIKVTENFRLGVAAATGGIALLYLINFGMSFFGSSIPMIHEGGLMGIGFSVFVVVIAALNLVLDFDFIEHGAEVGAPKYMEWYASFGLMVTLVWLYLEILRLLAKSRD